MQPKISNARPYSDCLSQRKWLWCLFFIKELGKKFNKDDIWVIAENRKKYISSNVKLNGKLAVVTKKGGKEVRKNIKLRFIGYYKFMASNLDKLDSKMDNYQCKNLEKFYKKDEVLKLLRCKVLYLYECMSSWEKFNKKLPRKK